MVVQAQATRGRNYIGGRWVEASSGETFGSRNPANTREVIGVFPRSGPPDADLAVKAALKAYDGWRAMSRIRRAEVLDAYAQLVKRETEPLACLVARECGKVLNEARADVVEGLHMVQYVAGRARMPAGEVYASEIAEKDSYVYRRPKGVVACITPWNFPFAIPMWLLMAAIGEGNTAVFKPAEETPAVGHRIAELLEEAGLPPGVLNLVQGHGEEVGWPLVTHPDVDLVLFTGSAEVGSRIKQACAADYRKMAVCEMGGKNAVIVFDDARLELAVNAAILSGFKTAGQRCVSAGRILVQEGVVEDFIREFVSRARRIQVGDPLDEGTFMGPLVSEAGLQKVLSYNELAPQEGGEVLLAGGRLTEKAYARGYFLSPFIYRMSHNPEARVLREEVFGPHVAIVPFRTVEEAIHIYNDTEYGFALSVITEDFRKARQVRLECEHGVGYWNLPTIGAEVHLPFGGLKRSGTGMPSAAALIDAVTHKTSWTMNHGETIQMAQGLKAEV